VSCLNQQQVESFLLAYNGCSKVLSTVGKLCGFMQAHCAVVNRAFMEYLLQQGRVINLNSHLIIDIVWELLAKMSLPTL